MLQMKASGYSRLALMLLSVAAVLTACEYDRVVRPG